MILSVIYGFIMLSIIGSYLAMMYLSNEFQVIETSLIAFLAVGSLLTYMYAIYIKPKYLPLPNYSSEEEFLELLKRLQN